MCPFKTLERDREFRGLAGNILAVVLSATVVFPWGWAATGVIVCTAIGMVFGLYPAWKAASLDPIDALRYE